MSGGEVKVRVVCMYRGCKRGGIIRGGEVRVGGKEVE